MIVSIRIYRLAKSERDNASVEGLYDIRLPLGRIWNRYQIIGRRIVRSLYTMQAVMTTNNPVWHELSLKNFIQETIVIFSTHTQHSRCVFGASSETLQYRKLALHCSLRIIRMCRPTMPYTSQRRLCTVYTSQRVQQGYDAHGPFTGISALCTLLG